MNDARLARVACARFATRGARAAAVAIGHIRNRSREFGWNRDPARKAPARRRRKTPVKSALIGTSRRRRGGVATERQLRYPRYATPDWRVADVCGGAGAPAPGARHHRRSGPRTHVTRAGDGKSVSGDVERRAHGARATRATSRARPAKPCIRIPSWSSSRSQGPCSSDSCCGRKTRSGCPSFLPSNRIGGSATR